MSFRLTMPFVFGVLTGASVLGFSFSVVSLVSGWRLALEQFRTFWYFTAALAIGFGLQVGLYAYLRQAASQAAGGGTLVVSGASSTVAMVSCCSHYLVNILPIIGVSALAAFIGQYQVELFWFGLIMNLAGLIYIGRKLLVYRSRFVTV